MIPIFPERGRHARKRRTVGEIAMCPRVSRMGVKSGDGLAQNNPVWGDVEAQSKAVHKGVVGPRQIGTTKLGYAGPERRRQTKCPLTNARSRFKRWIQWEGPV